MKEYEVEVVLTYYVLATDEEDAKDQAEINFIEETHHIITDIKVIGVSNS